jgi:hypothetical protein
LHNLLIDDAESAPTEEEIQQILEEERDGNLEHDQINQQEPDAERRERGFGETTTTRDYLLQQMIYRRHGN